MNPSKAMIDRVKRPALLALALLLSLAPTAQGFLFDFGELKGTFDTTLSVGGLYRLNNPNPEYYGILHTFDGVPGQQRSSNADDGNLNYAQGMSSFLVKANNDFQLSYHQTGLFVRSYVFNDFVNSNGTRHRTALSKEAKEVVAEGAELLDAYVYLKESIGDMPATFRLGRQVLSWGESTFIPNGINSINPIDVGKLRSPGSELKEALRPLNMASFSLNITQSLSLESFYLFDWERTRIDPPGTLFSSNDFVAQGGKQVYLGFGGVADYGSPGAIPRGPDTLPGKSGQYGVNLHLMVDKLNNTEFGVYFMNYHSRLPVISARTPTTPIAPFVPGHLATLLIEKAGVPAAAAPATATGLLTLAATNPGALSAGQVALINGAKTLGFLSSAGTAQYLIEFPKDIGLVGASFNTSLKGIALQGEISYRSNQPLQVDDVELLFAALSSINPAFATNNQIGAQYTGLLNTYVSGYRKHKVWTGQMTATKVGNGIFGANQSTLVGEIGFVQADIGSKGTLRYDGSGTFVGGDVNYMNNTGNNASGVPPASEPASAFADEFSWGYQLVGKLDYNNAFRGVNVSPLLVLAHDVGGNTPLPLGNFIHGRKTLTIGADFSFQNAWAMELRYVNFFGAGRYNLLSDRDYVSATVKYSF